MDSNSVVVDGKPWNVRDTKQDCPGGIILFVHGFPLDHSMWAGQIERLSSHCRIIAPDLPGFGGSHVVDGTITMSEYADGLSQLLDTLSIDEPIHFCGLSMGGYVGWEFWRRHNSRLKSLIQADTRAVADSQEVARARQIMAQTIVNDGSPSVADSMIGKLFGPQAAESIPKVVKHTHKVMAETDPRGIGAAQRGMAERADFVESLGEISVPSLLVCGAADGISPPDEMRAIADAMPNAAFVEIADAGHLAPLEQPGAFNDAVMSFLTE